MISRSGGLVRCVLGLALLAYGGYAYVNHIGNLVGLIPAVVGLYLLVRGVAGVASSKR